jgi:hypothetical protein
MRGGVGVTTDERQRGITHPPVGGLGYPYKTLRHTTSAVYAIYVKVLYNCKRTTNKWLSGRERNEKGICYDH